VVLLLSVSLGSKERLSPAAKRGAIFVYTGDEHEHAGAKAALSLPTGVLDFILEQLRKAPAAMSSDMPNNTRLKP